MTGSLVWIDGSFAGRIDPADRGLLLGDGVFDTAVAFRRVVFAGARHIDRLTHQAAAIGIEVDPAAVRSGWDAVLARAPAKPHVLRTTVTRGVTERGLWPASTPTPTIMVAAAPWSASLFGREVRLVTSSIRRNESSPAAQLKSLGYLDNILAAREATEKGAEDALFLNHAGRIACTTIANIFLIAGEQLLAPPIADGVLPGIMRALVLEAAESAGLRPAKRSLMPADLLSADAVFLTNSVRFLSPVNRLDARPLGASARGRVAALTDTLAAQVVRECGVDPRGAA